MEHPIRDVQFHCSAVFLSRRWSVPNNKRAAIVGAIVGFLVCSAILILLYFYGVWYLCPIGRTDLRAILWPSSIMLTVGWRTTMRGVLITLSAVAINCAVYAGVFLFLSRAWHSLVKRPQPARSK
jgi:hypothetical protein